VTAERTRAGSLYRLLVHAYPPGPRRQELLDTIADRIGTGRSRVRPSLPQVISLLRHGLRARLGRPTSRAIVPIALLIAVCSAYPAAVLTARLALSVEDSVPPPAVIEQVKAAALPGLQTDLQPCGWQDCDTGQRTPDRITTAGPDDVQYGFASYSANYSGATDPSRLVADARDRLTAAGWTMKTATNDGFTASRGDFSIRFTDDRSSGFATLSLWRGAPSVLPLIAALGAAAGFIVAFCLTCWASRRLEHRPAADTVGRLGVTMYVLLLLPFTLLFIQGFADTEGTISTNPFFALYMLFYPFPMLAAVAAAVVLALAYVAGDERIRRLPQFAALRRTLRIRSDRGAPPDARPGD
jgi:hypothetical protein